MSGRGARGRGGRGRGGRGGQSGRGRGYSHSGSSSTRQVGLCKELGSNVFDYGSKGAADQMRQSWEKLCQCVGTDMSEDIANELRNETRVVIEVPTHTDDVMARHQTRETVIEANRFNLQNARNATLQAMTELPEDEQDVLAIAKLENEIALGDLELNEPVPIQLTADEKTQYDNAWRAYRQRKDRLEKNRGQCYSLVLGQCTQLLQDRMQQDTQWDTVKTSNDPLLLYSLIKRTVQGQTDDQYPYATVYEQLVGLFGYRQETMTNAQWYERFNTRVDVANAIGVSFLHPALLTYQAGQDHDGSEYDALTDAEKETIKTKVTERFLGYIMLRQSSKKHNELKSDLQNGFTTGDNKYPDNRQQTLHLLDHYSPRTTQRVVESQGSSFAQQGKGGDKGGDGRSGKEYDKEYWKDKTCFKCGKKGHPAYVHDKKGKNNNEEDDDDKSTAESVKQLAKSMKNMNKRLTTINTQLGDLQSDNASSVSASDEEGSLNVQYAELGSEQFQFAQVESPRFEPAIERLFKQSASSRPKDLDLRKVLLIDSQSTVDLFCDPSLCTEVYKTNGSMRLNSNGGNMRISQKAKVKGYFRDAWFDVRAITNIVALANVQEQYRVTCDSWSGGDFVVHRECDGKPNMLFRRHASGLHYHDPRDEEHFTFVSTVEDNKKQFTKRQIQRADVAKNLYSKLHFPSWRDFKWIVAAGMVRNSPVTLQDIKNCETIYGKDVAALKGKTVRKQPKSVATDIVKVPKEFLKLHNEVEVDMDIFFVNKIPFFISLSKVIYFTAITHLANRKVETIFMAFKQIYGFYMRRGFRIVMVNADGEFDALKPLIESLPGGPRVNCAAKGEHVPMIERRIRVVKERCRSIRSALPFMCIPFLITVWTVMGVGTMINAFPTKGSISATLSPMTIMSGEVLDYKKQLALQVGSYCQVHEEEFPRNSQLPRTRGAIALGPTGNVQGGFRFMALNTGRVITRYSWDSLPMPDTVIARVNYLGRDQPKQFIFTNRHGQEIGDVSAPGPTPEYPDLLDNDNTNHVDPIVIPGVDDDVEITGVDGANDAGNVAENEDPQAQELDINDPVNVETDPLPVDEGTEPPDTDDPILPPPEEPTTNAPNPEVGNQPESVPEEPATVPIFDLRRSSRRRQAPASYVPSMSGNKYSYTVTQLAEKETLHPDAHMFVQEDFYQAEPDVVATVMTQLSLKAGLREWGDRAHDAAYMEMKQLHMRNTFKPKHYRELTEHQRLMLLESHMFLKLKRSGDVKGRTVAGGNKQRDYISKEDASSPTVAVESVLLSCIIDAEEGRDVATVDIPNAFIQTQVEDEQDQCVIRLRGFVVDLLEEIAPDVYKPYITIGKNGTKTLIVQCLNAIYGAMKASLLFYRKFTKSIKSIGFEINPYDPCVANRIVRGKQQTILFHVDDNKISHVDSEVNDELIDWLRENYESIFEDGSGKMKVCRGKVHDFLGMKLDFTTPRQVKVTMFEYVQEILDAYNKIDPKDTGLKTTAAPKDLFVVDEDCEKLNQDKAVAFHNIVAKVLFATKRARPDTCTAIAYLTTRVREPDKDDWQKLRHHIQYLRMTKDLALILSADGTGILKWWIDASFAVHPNMRGHSGGGLSMGRGCPIVGSTKQKLNTRSSTETEVVGVDDFMPSILWTRYFLIAQGYSVSDNILAQDNKSSILLEQNGKASSSKRTKHINIRYFFVTDRIAKGELKVEWCPTLEMIGDYMTKPLQGSLFRKFRDLIMGVVPIERQNNVKEVSKKEAAEPTMPRKKKKKNLASPTKTKRRHRSVLDLKEDHSATYART